MRTPITALASRVAAGVRNVILNQPPSLGDSDCEAFRKGLMAQPVNTLTSLPFLGVGVWAASRVPSLHQEERTAAAAFAAMVALNGVGSAAYHGPQFPGAQTLHDVPAYGAVALGVGVPLWRKLRGRTALPGWSNAKGGALAAANVVAAASYVEGRTASRMCDPDSWVQLHGLWHLSTAAVMAVWTTVLWPEASDSVADLAEVGDHRASAAEVGDA